MFFIKYHYDVYEKVIIIKYVIFFGMFIKAFRVTVEKN